VQSDSAAGYPDDDPVPYQPVPITLKDTSIPSVIGIAEMTQTGGIIIARNFQSCSPLVTKKMDRAAAEKKAIELLTQMGPAAKAHVKTSQLSGWPEATRGDRAPLR
jgi:hypothetical protein